MNRTFQWMSFVKFCFSVIPNCRNKNFANFKGLKESKADLAYLLKSQALHLIQRSL